jgi:hypothetical protein
MVFMNSKTITHSTFGIVTNWEQKLDIRDQGQILTKKGSYFAHI